MPNQLFDHGTPRYICQTTHNAKISPVACSWGVLRGYLCTNYMSDVIDTHVNSVPSGGCVYHAYHRPPCRHQQCYGTRLWARLRVICCPSLDTERCCGVPLWLVNGGNLTERYISHFCNNLRKHLALLHIALSVIVWGYVLSLNQLGGAHMENTLRITTMNWDMIVSNVLSNATIYLLGRLMDNWLNRRNK